MSRDIANHLTKWQAVDMDLTAIRTLALRRVCATNPDGMIPAKLVIDILNGNAPEAQNDAYAYLAAYVKRGRRQNLGWRAISQRLKEETGESISHETLRSKFPPAEDG